MATVCRICSQLSEDWDRCIHGAEESSDGNGNPSSERGKGLDLLRPSFTLTEYVALLQRFYGFHRCWEPEVATLLEDELPQFFAPRRKLPNLEADLFHFEFEAKICEQFLCVGLYPRCERWVPHWDHCTSSRDRHSGDRF